jgi:adenine nucleotide transporter 17
MWSEEGLSSLWSGTVPSLVLVSNPAIKFTIYEWLKRKMLSDGGSFLTPTEAFFTGVVASAIATLVTYPVQVIQAKARVKLLITHH